MKRYRITPQARDDIRQIVEFVAQRNAQAARTVFDALATGIRAVGRRPGIGHVRDDIVDESLRFLPVYSYLNVYRGDIRPVQIVRILHGARDLRNAL